MSKPFVYLKRTGKSILLVSLLLVLITGSVFADTVTLLNDGFEGSPWDDNWNGNGATLWTRGADNPHSGSFVARAAKNTDGHLTSDDLNTSDAISIVVDFWFLKTGTDATDFTLYYYDGSTYDLITELDSYGGDDTWWHYSQTITDAQYFIPNFRIRFDATLGGNFEFAYIDDVLVTKDTGATLTVTRSGDGSGTVTSNPAGIDCGLDCSQYYVTDTVVTLSAVPAIGSAFTGWSGACTGTGDCVVTMSTSRSVDAEFTQDQYTLSVSVTGNGAVGKSPDQATYTYGTEVTLTPNPAAGWSFSAWGGACSGSGACIVTMNGNRSVTATFTQDQYTLDVTVIGSGTVGKSPDQATYTYSTEVTLTPVPAAGWSFSEWGGACSGSGACIVTMNGNRSVTATFTPVVFKLYLPLLFRNY